MAWLRRRVNGENEECYPEKTIKKMTETERAYYDRRAAEYDDFYLGTGLFAQRARPGWAAELAALRATLRSLDFSSFLDVACGTGFLTESFLTESRPGKVTGLDQSSGMLALARSRIPGASFVRGDALALPFPSMQFDCLVAAHFYGHLDQPARKLFCEEARRVARNMLVVDAAQRDDVPPEEYQQRVLNDGSRHVVYKRYFTAEKLIAELGTGRALHAGRWFVAVLA
jgi:demethylmenaquinone methyltransferase/2-methoxy-6-polyprenyl-1,4-benzoquinol methylase